MNDKAAIREKQMQQAEDLIFAGPQEMGFAKGLFHGQYLAETISPYPTVPKSQADEVDATLAEIQRFVDEKLDPRAIDEQADIPRETIDQLGELGVLGMAAPKEFGGRGFGQVAYCKMLEIIGGACSSTSVFVNAHHSIGLRALILFGTEEQQRKWLPPMASGEKIAAFALTEPEAGSDAANVQTMAVPSEDGSHYILNGEKRYITSGGIAQVLTVMARTPVPGKKETQVTAFLVTPNMPGFEVTEARMPKLGIRGTATAKMRFNNVAVPKENILGPLGKGLKVALTVLDFGRTTFGATCTGAAKTCLRLAVEHANRRRQFDQTLGEFELVKKKIARMAAWTYAMEAMTNVTAGMIDSGMEDYMLETAMLKVWSTEALWTIVNDAFQIYGGAAYFNDQPLERMLRDARINQIGEGANEVLTSFIALVGMRGPGERLKDIHDSLGNPFRALPKIVRFAFDRTGHRLTTPEVPVRHPSLTASAERVGRLIKQLNSAIHKAMITHGEDVLDRQYVHERIANVAMELFASGSVLSRLDAELAGSNHAAATLAEINPAGDLLLTMSARRMREQLRSLGDNDDAAVTATADWVLSGEM